MTLTLVLLHAMTATMAGHPPLPQRTDLHGDPLPAGAVARLGTVRLRRDDQSTGSVAFTADGKRLLSGRTERVLQFWDVATGRPMQELRHEHRVETFVASRDGKVVASRGIREVTVWDLAGPKARCAITVPERATLALSSTGTLLAVDTRDGVQLWDAVTGAGPPRLLHQSKYASALTFTPDDKQLIIAESVAGGKEPGARTSSLNFYDVKTGRRERKLDVAGSVTHLAISADGKTLVSGGYDQVKQGGWFVSESRLFLWEVPTGRLVRRLTEPRHYVIALAICPRGRWLAAAEQQSTQVTFIWDLTTRKEARRIEGGGWGSVDLAFSPDGTMLAGASGGTHRVVDLWDVRTGKSLRPAAPNGGGGAIAFSPDGKLVVTTPGLGDEDKGLAIWDAATGRFVRSCEGSYRYDQLAFTADGKGLWAAGDHLRRWDVATGKRTHEVPVGDAAVSSLAFSTEGTKLTTLTFAQPEEGREDRAGTVRVHDAATGKAERTRTVRHKVPYAVPLSPDGALFVDQVGKTLTLWETATGNSPGKLELLDPRNAERFADVFAFTADGRHLAAVTHAGWVKRGGQNRPVESAVRVWELASRKEVLRIAGIKHEPAALAVAPDGRTIATSGDGLTQLWDVATGKEVLALAGQDANTCHTAVAFSPDGSRLAVGYGDATALIWDVTPVRRRAVPPGKLDDAAFDRLWADLAADDARKAHAAVWTLVAQPADAVPRLSRRLTPAEPVDAKHLRGLIRDLDSDRRQVRDAAAAALERLDQAGPALQAALDTTTSAEVRSRATKILAKLREQSPDGLRTTRAVHALEAIGSADARRHLAALAGGPPAAPLTRDAAAAVTRLGRRK